MIRLAVVALGVALLVGLAGPADAHEQGDNCATPGDYVGSASGSLCYPVPPTSVVVVQSTGGIWKMRVFAESLDAGLSVDIRSGRCADYPGSFCVNVARQNLAPATHGGICYYREDRQGVDIVLNDAYHGDRRLRAYRRMVASHEFLHALGMRHHAGPGLLGDYATMMDGMSPDEWHALTDAYPL